MSSQFAPSPALRECRPSEAAWKRAGSRWAPVPELVEPSPAELLYVAVDNVFGDQARIVVSRWPKLSREGRELFGDLYAAWVELAGLHDRVSRQRITLDAQGNRIRGRDGRTRRIEAGDVFACSGLDASESSRRARDPYAKSWSDLSRELPHLGKWLRRPIFDLTGLMRTDAKAVFSAAVAPPLEREQMRELRSDEEAEDAGR